MKPIYINGRFLIHNVTGTERYALELLRALDDLLDGKSDRPAVTLLVPPGARFLPTYRNMTVTPIGTSSGRRWEQIDLYRHSRDGFLFTPCGGSPLLHRASAVTIHDAAVFAAPQGYSRGFVAWYRFLYRQLCRRARHIFTVSHFSKAELMRHAGAADARTSVNYLGSEHAFRQEGNPEVLQRTGLSDGRYVLGVGSRNPNKNLIGLSKAAVLLQQGGTEMVLAGGTDTKVFRSSDGDVPLPRSLGYVSDAELRALYQHAGCFVFPSFYEGFGLPPLEALAAGCPIVVSRGNSLGEIFHEIAFLCDPSDPADIASKVQEALATGPEFRERCMAFAREFRWSSCARETWKTLQALAAS